MKKTHKIFILLGIILGLFLIAPLIISLPESQFLSNTDVPISNDGRFIEVNGFSTYIEDLNTASNKVITFIHGFGGSTFSWRSNKNFFVENGFRVLLIDLKGFGLSQKSIEQDYSHISQSEFIKNILDSLGIENTILVGHSMGGNVVTTFTQTYPNLVSKLVLVDASIVENSNNNIFSSLLDRYPVRNWATLILGYGFSKERFTEFLSSAYINKAVVTQDVIDGYFLPLTIKNWQDSLIGISRDSIKNQIPKSLDSINLPVLIIWGEKDPWISLDEGRSINSKIKSSVLKVIPEVGHLPMEEAPDTFNDILIEWILNN